MVAVISGNGLGLDNSSLRSLGQGGQAAIGQGNVAPYLNAASGNLVLEGQDEGLVFDGLPLNVLRTYNSQGQLSGSDGWQFGFSRSVGGLTGTLDTAGSTITRTDDDGSTVIYTYNASQGDYVSSGQSGTQDTLSWNTTSSSWTWTDAADQQQETYNASGQLTVLSDTSTGASYSFAYSGGQLSTIVAGDGDTLTFGYNPSHQLTSLSITEVPPGGSAAVTRQQVSYAYDTQGRLSTVTTTLGSDTDSNTGSYTTTYGYDGTSDRVTSVSQSDGTVVSYTYAADTNGLYRVASITTGTGAAAQALSLTYNLTTDTTTVTNVLGQATTYQYNAAGDLTQVTAPAVNGSSPTTSYSYDANGNLLQMTDADGGITSYGYDASGNLLSVEDPTGHTVSYTYNAADQVLSQTVYTVAAQGVVGQSGYVAPSGAQTTYDVYDASNRLSYVIDPLGNVTQYTYTTATGGITVLGSTQQYLGASYPLAGLSPTTPPTLASLQSWVASSPVQSTLAQSTRIDYSYDVRGQLTTQTQWDTVNSSGAGVLDAGTVITTTTYDAQGRLLQTSTESGANRTTLQTTSYAYDGLGRLISRTDPLGNVTSYVYTDSANTLAITQANGLTTTQVRNSAGQLVSSVQSASGQASRTTSYLYNAAGQQVATIDPAGNVSYTFYDADGRVSGTVEATGAVTAYTYDADGHVIGTTQYATPISPGSWVSGGALTASLPTSLPVPTANAADRSSHVIVDAAGRVLATIDAEGNVTTTAYDGEGHAISTTAYATALAAPGSAVTWQTLQAELIASPQDRTTDVLYDADGRAAATIDASGDVTTTTYDAAGHPVLVTAYATPLTATLGSTPTLAALQPALVTSASDQTTRTYYDGEGRAVAQVDADGYLTTTGYDETTDTDTTTRYATVLSAAQLSALTGTENITALVGLLGTAPASEVSTISYNAADQVASRTAVDGTVTTYSYNTVGQLLSSTVTPTAGQGNARTTATQYDAFGEVTGTLDGVGAANLTSGMTAAQQAAVFAQDGTTTTYNMLGQRISATDPLGNVTYSYYDAGGRLAYTVQGQPSGATRNALGNVTAYQYNAFGQLASTTQYASQLTLTRGSSSGSTLNPATATVVQVASAAAALPVSASDANSLTTYAYTLDGQVASRTDGLGYQTAYQYNAFGDRTQVQQQLSQPGSALSAANSTTSTFAYDVRGEQTGETDGVGSGVARSTSSTYDAFGRVTSTTDGNGSVVTYGYDNLGRQINTFQMVDGAGRLTQTTYDAFDRMVTQTDALGNVTQYQYNLAAHTTTVITPDGVTMTTAKDAFGDTVGVTDGAGDTTTYAYDADGHLLTTKDALGNTATNMYDADGELIQTTDATGDIVTYAYDASGRVLTRTVDPTSVDPTGLNLVTTYAYDGQGRELSVTDPLGSVTTYTYDADGNTLTQVQDAGAGKLNLTTTSTYDGEGKTLTVTVGAGTSAARTTQYVYDNLERLSQQIVDPGTGHLNLTTGYTYDGNDNVTSVTDANNNVTRYGYNEANEKMMTVDPLGNVTQFWYDADGRSTLTRGYALLPSPLQQPITLGVKPKPWWVWTSGMVTPSTSDSYEQSVYNADGQLIYQLSSTALNVVQYTYDAAGRVVQTDHYATPLPTDRLTNGSVSPTATATTIAPYVKGGLSDSLTRTSYNADGQAVYQIDGTGVVTQMWYDAAGRATCTTTYATPLNFDQLTNLGTVPWSTQAIARVITTSTADRSSYVGYDMAGREMYAINAAGAVTQTAYDADGRVTMVHAYATALPAMSLATLGTAPTAVQIGALIASSSNDQVSYNVYDAAGELRYAIDPMGYVTETRYDTTGLVVETLAYANAVSVGNEAAALQQGTGLSWISGAVGGPSGTNPDSSAEATLHLYDTAGRQRFTVQQNNGGTTGTVTEQRYDANGNVVTQIAYGAALTVSTATSLAAQWITASLSTALASTTAANEHVTNTVYDADNRAIYTINAVNDVTQTSYDAFGHVIETQQYANPITLPATLTASSVAAAVTAAGGATGEQYTTTAYTSLGQVEMTGDVLGINATYTYDGRGLKTSYTNRDRATWNYSYNADERLILEQSPSVNVGSWTGTNGAFQQGMAYLYTSTTYTAFGDVASISQGSGASSSAIITLSTTTYGYDAAGHQITTTYPATATSPAVSTHVTYNTLGEAVVDEDADGHYQYNVYNADGELAYAVDADGYVTATSYDAYGNVTATTRYATGLNTAAIAGWSPGQPLSSAQLLQGRVTSASDRTLTTTYNQRNQKTQVVQPSIAYDLSMGALAGTAAIGSPTTTYTYDAYGNVTSTATLIQGALTVGATTTPAVWATTYTYYDALNRAVMVVMPTGSYTSPQGYVTTTAYNAFNTVASTTQYAQAISTSAISTTAEPGLPAAPTAASGANRVTTYTYDAIGRVHSETDSGGYNYTGASAQGQLNGTAGYTTAISAASSVTSYTYDGENRVLTATVNGATTTTTYDALGRVTGVTSPAHQVLAANWQSTLQSIPSDDLTSTAPSAALYTTVNPYTYYIYDALGHTLVTTVTNSQNSAAQQTWAWYDARGNQIQVQDADGNEHYSTYDNNGNVLTQSYTLTGNSGNTIVTTAYTYDGNGQQLGTTVQRSGQTGYDSDIQVKYDAFGDVVAKGDGNPSGANGGYEATYTYNNAGQQTSAPSSTTGAIHTYVYDLLGNRVLDQSTVTGGSATTWTHNEYNLSNQVIWQRTPATNATSGVNGGSQATYTYDRWGNVLSSTDANGNTTTYQYDSQNHRIEETEAAVLVVSATGTSTTTTPTQTWYYDVDGELMGTTDENGNASWNLYDVDGNLQTATDATGASTYTSYDALGRAVAQETPSANMATGLEHITYTTYNNLNQVTSQGDFLLNSAGNARTQNAQETYLLNSNGDRIQVTDALGTVLDSNGNSLQVSTALGHTSYYTYDSQHRVIKSQTPLQYTTGQAQTYTYDDNGNLIQQTDADGNSQSWIHDYFGRLLSHVDESGAKYTYTYDANSGLLTKETSNWTATGPTSSANSSLYFNYMADGQMASINQVVGGVTQVVAGVTQVVGGVASTYAYQYDADRNEIQETDTTKDGSGQAVTLTTTSTYDSHNRLSTFSQTSSTNTTTASLTVPALAITYTYDGAGNRRKVVATSGSTSSATGSTTTDWYTYDADNRVLVTNGSLVNGQIVITDAINSAQNGYDAAGNVTLYTTVNTSGQTLSQKNTYDVRGELTMIQTQATPGGSYATSETRSYDANGHILTDVMYNLPGHQGPGTYNGSTISFSDAGWVASDTIYTYNASGELTDLSEYAEDTPQDLITKYGNGVATSAYASQDATAPGTLPAVGSNTDGALYLATENSYANATGYGYDADGNLLGYSTVTSGNLGQTARTDSYKNSYVLQDNALNLKTTASTTSGTYQPNTNTNTYNDLGELIATSGTVSGNAINNAMAFTADGKILQDTLEGSSATVYAYANDQGVASINNSATVNLLDTTSGFSNSDLGSQSYTIQVGDTLESLAQAIYGDSNYDYILAQANGLQVGMPLIPGSILKIPQLTTHTNAANTFKPYSQSAIVNGGASTCLTTAQMITNMIEATLNQQSALAQVINKIQAEEAAAAAAAAAAATRPRLRLHPDGGAASEGSGSGNNAPPQAGLWGQTSNDGTLYGAGDIFSDPDFDGSGSSGGGTLGDLFGGSSGTQAKIDFGRFASTYSDGEVGGAFTLATAGPGVGDSSGGAATVGTDVQTVGSPNGIAGWPGESGMGISNSGSDDGYTGLTTNGDDDGSTSSPAVDTSSISNFENTVDANTTNIINATGAGAMGGLDAGEQGVFNDTFNQAMSDGASANALAQGTDTFDQAGYAGYLAGGYPASPSSNDSGDTSELSSAMPLNGNKGPLVDFFVAPEDSLSGGATSGAVDGQGTAGSMPGQVQSDGSAGNASSTDMGQPSWLNQPMWNDGPWAANATEPAWEETAWGNTQTTTFNGDGSSLQDPSVVSAGATNLGAVNVPADPFIQGMEESQGGSIFGSGSGGTDGPQSNMYSNSGSTGPTPSTIWTKLYDVAIRNAEFAQKYDGPIGGVGARLDVGVLNFVGNNIAAWRALGNNGQGVNPFNNLSVDGVDAWNTRFNSVATVIVGGIGAFEDGLDGLGNSVKGMFTSSSSVPDTVTNASDIRSQVLSNIADSQAARASSNFSQFTQTEGQLQESLGIWPPNGGAYAATYDTTLDVGTQLDRYGYPGGNYLSPLGDSFEGRALPSSYETTKPYFQYEVTQPIPGVTQSNALPWFGQPGTGTQFQVQNSVQWYLDNGYLKVIR